MTIANFVDSLIPEKLKHSEFEHRKAKAILYTYVVCLFTSVLLGFITPFISNESLSTYVYSTICLIILIFTFRFFNNTIYPANLLACFLAVLLVPLTLNGGSLYSDNVVWLFLVPVIAFFLGNLTSGIVWTIALLGFQFYLLRLEQQAETSFLTYMTNISPEFYFISYAFFFMLMATFIAIFKRNQNKIIQALKDQKSVLAEQKKALSEKAEELELIQKNLEYTNKELEQFAYIVSHDLKAPLRNINSFSQLLERSLKKSGKLAPNTAEYLGFITGSVSNMNQLITDLITYARAGNCNEEEDPSTEMEEIKLRIQNDLQSIINETEAQIFWQNMPEIIQVPKVKLIQILQNLISNALKYQSPGSPPVVIVSCFEHKKFWEFSVKDNGVGIAKEDQKRVFDIFVKLQSEHYQRSSGIGLTTCKKIVDQMGGKITLKSEPGNGSVFHFEIPKIKKKKKCDKVKEETMLVTT